MSFKICCCEITCLWFSSFFLCLKICVDYGEEQLPRILGHVNVTNHQQNRMFSCVFNLWRYSLLLLLVNIYAYVRNE